MEQHQGAVSAVAAAWDQVKLHHEGPYPNKGKSNPNKTQNPSPNFTKKHYAKSNGNSN